MNARMLLSPLLSAASFLFDTLVLAGVPAAKVEGAERRAMFIRTDQIGDFVLWLPAARQLIQEYRAQGYRVLIVASRECAVLARSIEGVDEVLPLDRTAFRFNPFYRAAFLRRLRKSKVVEAIQPSFSRQAPMGDALVRATGAERRLAFRGDTAGTTRLEKWLGDRHYTELFPNPDSPIIEARVNETMLERLGVPPGQSDPPSLPRRRFQGNLPDRYYILAPGSSRGIRQWPVENFAEIARLVHAASDMVGVICGSVADKPLAEQIARRTTAPLIDLTGKTDLLELVDVVGRSRFVLTNDTAAVHVAAAMGTESVCIVGGGHFGRFVPYDRSELFRQHAPPRVAFKEMPCFGCDWVCRFRPFGSDAAPCIAAVTVAQVWEQIAGMIEEEDRKPIPAHPGSAASH